MKVGIIGAGTMGSGIAQAFAQTEGYEVMLCDVKAEWAAAGKAKIAKGFEKRVAKGKMEQMCIRDRSWSPTISGSVWSLLPLSLIFLLFPWRLSPFPLDI